MWCGFHSLVFIDGLEVVVVVLDVDLLVVVVVKDGWVKYVVFVWSHELVRNY